MAEFFVLLRLLKYFISRSTRSEEATALSDAFCQESSRSRLTLTARSLLDAPDVTAATA